MSRTARFALPVVGAATILASAGCGSYDGGYYDDGPVVVVHHHTVVHQHITVHHYSTPRRVGRR